MQSLAVSKSKLGPDFSNLTVLIPTLNEEKCIGNLLQELAILYPDIKIIVVDDGSIDNTQTTVRELATQYFKTGTQISLLDRSASNTTGLCASILDAIKQCNTDYFVVMDADFQHPPEHIPDFLDAMNKGANLVLGIRGNLTQGLSLFRVCITRLATLMAYVRLKIRGMHVRDPLSGYFAGETELVKELIEGNRDKFEPSGYKILFDVLKILPSTAKVATVNYRFDERALGVSKLRLKHGLLFIRSLFS